MKHWVVNGNYWHLRKDEYGGVVLLIINDEDDTCELWDGCDINNNESFTMNELAEAFREMADKLEEL